MKRYFLAFLLALVIVAVMLYYLPQPLHRAMNIADQVTCNVYCRKTTLSAISVGYGYIVECLGKNLSMAIANCHQIDGVSFAFYGSFTDFLRIAEQLNLQVHSNQTFDDLTVLCGYSAKIRGYLFVDGRKTNLQMAYRNGVITVGSPLILGSY